MKQLKVIKTQEKAFACPSPPKSLGRHSKKKKIKNTLGFSKNNCTWTCDCDGMWSVLYRVLYECGSSRILVYEETATRRAAFSLRGRCIDGVTKQSRFLFAYQGLRRAVGVRHSVLHVCFFVFWRHWHCDGAVFHSEIPSSNRSFKPLLGLVDKTTSWGGKYSLMCICRVFNLFFFFIIRFPVFPSSLSSSPIDASWPSTRIYD